VYREAREANPNLLIVDAGDFSMRRPIGGEEASRFMADMLPRLGYRAWTPGESELFRGRAFFDDLVGRLTCAGVSANLRDSLDAPLLPADTVLTVGHLRVGVTGVTAPAVLTSLGPEERGRIGAFRLLDPVVSLAPVVAGLAGRSDLVVVLAHADGPESRRLAEAVPGIDVVVVGHVPGHQPAGMPTERAGDAILVRGGERGQYLARLDLWFDASRRLIDDSLSVEPLTTAFPPDSLLGPDIQAFIDVMTRIETEATRQLSPPVNRDKYLGAEVCARCHADIHATWSRGPHATAFRTLESAGRQADHACLACHVTGWNDPTGYQLAVARLDSLGNRVVGDAAELRGVGCESCHGRGTAHGTDAMVTRVTEAACVTCHDAANDPDFDYATAVAGGFHHR
jgi:hypothetical protein